MDEPAPPRPQRGQALLEAGREDLDLFSVEELKARIALLEAEAARAQAAISRKQAGRSAADALFSFAKDP